MLVPFTLQATERPLSGQARDLLRQGRALFRTVDCFDFVPSDYELAWRVLDACPRGRFCEWGSGFGIVTALADLLGFDARGLEIDPRLVAAARGLAEAFQLRATFEVHDYLLSQTPADVYYVYCWPGRMAATEEHFDRIAPPAARLLICDGQSEIRCMARAEAGSE